MSTTLNLPNILDKKDNDHNNKRKPAYLLADSQLLFWQIADNPLIASLRNNLKLHTDKIIKAAYIGASNGDQAIFYELFVAAIDKIVGKIHKHECRQIFSSFNPQDREFIQQADLIMLAGGDCYAGWCIMNNSGMAELISTKYNDGCVLIGISAGAIQLGLGILPQHAQESNNYIDTCKASHTTLQIVPYYIDVHDESEQWGNLRNFIKQQTDHSKGLAISTGAGLIFHPDATIEPLKPPSKLDSAVKYVFIIDSVVGSEFKDRKK